MASSLISKKKIARSLKKLMMTTDFDKISIVDIMEQAQMRRQTFYSHFIDKYDLVEWIFQTELNEQIHDNLDYVTAENLLLQLAQFFTGNRDFYQKLFKFEGQNNFHEYFHQFCQQIIQKIVADYQRDHSLGLQEQDVDFFVSYHSAALANYFQILLKQGENFKEDIPYLVIMINASLASR